MLVRLAVGGNQVRRVGRHAGACTDVSARLEIGDEQGLLCDLGRACFHVSAGPVLRQGRSLACSKSTNCGSAVALISVVAFGGSESHDVVVAALANYDGAR
jgi:hypothetical protein